MVEQKNDSLCDSIGDDDTAGVSVHIPEDQIERIRQLEGALGRLTDAIERVDAALDAYEGMWDDYCALDAYYSGKLWWDDLAADEEGRLPDDLSRGILSEDGIYDALGSAEALRDRLRELAGRS